jgi:hypothetical protein
MPDWSCVELKHLDVDEFAHWSSQDFTRTGRTQRKRRELEVFSALAKSPDPPAGVVRIDAADERHVVDYARAHWLPANQADLRALHKQAVEHLSPSPAVLRR